MLGTLEQQTQELTQFNATAAIRGRIARLTKTFGNLDLPTYLLDSLTALDIAQIAPQESGHVSRLLDHLASLGVLVRTDDEYAYQLSRDYETTLRDHKFKAAAERYAVEHSGTLIELE